MTEHDQRRRVRPERQFSTQIITALLNNGGKETRVKIKGNGLQFILSVSLYEEKGDIYLHFKFEDPSQARTLLNGIPHEAIKDKPGEYRTKMPKPVLH